VLLPKPRWVLPGVRRAVVLEVPRGRAALPRHRRHAAGAVAPAPIFGPAEDTAFKFWRFASYAEGVAAEEGTAFWETAFAREAAADERLRRVVATYVQDRQVDSFTHSFPVSATCDLTEEFWLKNLDPLPEFVQADAALRQKSGYDQHVDSSSAIVFVAEAKLLWELGEDHRTGQSRTKRFESAAA
jgi:hypothetical protein